MDAPDDSTAHRAALKLQIVLGVILDLVDDVDGTADSVETLIGEAESAATEPQLDEQEHDDYIPQDSQL